ncbi:MAG: helix-turn-helix transcriptional regulator [Pyrinomonadaceae bacterium]|nr:helix-turn-helix transcriptional regulator [Pyrinomonadaceae bacterium]MBP6213638.1 helix-turn-helix transcriptional regulator [Pyrinomonadaceae bacterium]
MIYQLHIPGFPLDQFVGSIVYFSDVNFAHNFDRFLPNGDTEILIDFQDSPQFIYDNTSLKEIQACHRLWASGLRTEPITIPAGNKSEMMVISFKKGMAASFFPFPMNEIADSVVDADLVWGTDFGSLRERLLATSNISFRFQIVEDFLIKEFRSQLVVNPCVGYAIGEMAERPDEVNIARMNDKIGYSRKHFAEMFRRQVGVTPKSYLKIMRFQKAVKTIDSAIDIDWRQISLECGFYDQSHFINDFKHFSGFTPEQYAKIHTNYQNYIPVG